MAGLSAYRDQHFKGSRSDLERRLELSTTLYIGNLSFFTSEEQIYDLFSRGGDVKRIVMGLDRNRKTPCGFCFVEYYFRDGAESACRYVNGTRLDDRIIRADWDAGYEEGRQFGRGRSGGQVRDEYRTDFDEGRGGWGRLYQEKNKSAKKMSTSLRSEDELAVKYDQCLTDTLLKTSTGLGVGLLFSFVAFRRKIWPVAFGGGIGLGMAISNCQHEFRNIYPVRPVMTMKSKVVEESAPEIVSKTEE